ncbi:hypothetical protein K1719_022169 [Acacia pycnantha]|nr:hypothetical protein K1719_022169 [Acacia pycnantha]
MWSLAFCWLWSLERSFFDEGPIYAIPFITVNNTKNGKKMKQMKIQRLIEYSHFDYGLRSELARTSHPRQRRKRKSRQQVIHLLTEKRDALIPAPPVDERSPPKKMNEDGGRKRRRRLSTVPSEAGGRQKEAGLAAVRQLAAQGVMPGLKRLPRRWSGWSAELELSKQARRINRRRPMPRFEVAAWTRRQVRSAAASRPSIGIDPDGSSIIQGGEKKSMTMDAQER